MKIGITLLTSAALFAGVAVDSQNAEAFCGFYVSGGGAKMFNDATQVVLMRDGTRTVLSMQNDYNGPTDDFAMVVPVPVVLKEKDVKTLPKSVFDHVDSLGAPRLVEYWEQDPCYIEPPRKRMVLKSAEGDAEYSRNVPAGRPSTVKIEAKFAVGEYQILILSATEATGLESWLKANKYKIPNDAAPLLRPYIENGSKFFVAKVDPKKVKFERGRAALSPLRFSYDSEDFTLPIRLGLANAKDRQDLIVNVISKDQRYEVGNYKNVTIPTNFDVRDGVKTRFGEFYAALFDKTLEKNPGAVVTEYAWQASGGSMCDPCPPEETLVSPSDLALLGGDIIGGELANGSFVLTRLHARYGKADVKDDLSFRVAKPIVGGREFRNNDNQLEYGSSKADVNNFQARYAMRHAWTGPITCKNPRRGIWGGPWQDVDQDEGMILASKVAFAPRGRLALPSVVRRSIPELGIVPAAKKTAPTPAPGGGFAQPPAGGKKALSFGLGAIAALMMCLGGTAVARRRRTRSSQP